jgi:hypothetical protein
MLVFCDEKTFENVIFFLSTQRCQFVFNPQQLHAEREGGREGESKVKQIK